jgi:hypothetical protein
MRNDIEPRKEEILGWIAEDRSKAEIAKLLCCRVGTLQNALSRMGIEYNGNKGSRGRKSDKKYKSAEVYMTGDTYISSHRLKLKLIRDGVKEHRCEVCGTTEWMGNPVPVELDHIDGNRYNNDLSNLRIICPNCHAQTDTYSGKNVGKYGDVM